MKKGTMTLITVFAMEGVGSGVMAVKILVSQGNRDMSSDDGKGSSGSAKISGENMSRHIFQQRTKETKSRVSADKYER